MMSARGLKRKGGYLLKETLGEVSMLDSGRLAGWERTAQTGWWSGKETKNSTSTVVDAADQTRRKKRRANGGWQAVAGRRRPSTMDTQSE
jgi:hypothetical protein